jgi:YkoY family integral membrane protein
MYSSADMMAFTAIIVLNGLLSMDNALVIAALASKLPKHQQSKAIFIGIALGAILRLIALFFIAFIISNVYVKLLGGGYLIYICIKFFWDRMRADEEEGGHEHAAKDSFVHALIAITLADVAFSVDNVVAVAAITPKLTVLIPGMAIGIAIMAFATKLINDILLVRYKLLEHVAYIIVGFVGLVIYVEHLHELVPSIGHMPVHEEVKFIVIMAIVLGAIGFEEWSIRRRRERGNSRGGAGQTAGHEVSSRAVPEPIRHPGRGGPERL